MTMIQFAINVLFVIGLMRLGTWLEGINGINGSVDRLLTPIPLGMSGLFIAGLEWSLA